MFQLRLISFGYFRHKNKVRLRVQFTFNPKFSGGRSRWIPEFEASQVYRVSSRTARAIWRKKPKKEKKKKKKKR